MRHILSGMILAAALALPVATPVAAQGLFQPVIYVNDSAVTRYEVEQRQRFMRFLGAMDTTAADAQQALVDDRLRLQAASRLGIEITPEGLAAGQEEFAGRAGLTTDELIQRLAQGGIEPQVFRDFIEAGTVWREVVRARLLAQINVSEAEVEQELRRVLETPIIDRVALSELIIPAPPGQEAQAMAIAQRIVASNPTEAQFAAFAREFSAVPSAEQGGRLDVVRLNELPPSLAPIVTGLQPGQVTQPLTVEGAVVLFFLRDALGTLRPGARAQLLDYMTLRLATEAEAARLAQITRNCDDLYTQAGAAASQIRRQTQSPEGVPALIATRLASMDPDEATALPLGDGTAELVMLCSRQPALAPLPPPNVPVTAEQPDGIGTTPEGVPAREDVRNQVFNRKITAAAENLLADLRADALIRRP
ncbi:peptidylprolyl isomerase [Paracoccus sp. NSM]|uniref:peptidylprolyl isomerase n=1 Tax=Paracoccus sp. NSM TaxID=3457784 RepID=UPI00403588D3